MDGTVSKQVKVIQRKAFNTAQGLKDIGCAKVSAVFNQQKCQPGLLINHFSTQSLPRSRSH